MSFGHATRDLDMVVHGETSLSLLVATTSTINIWRQLAHRATHVSDVIIDGEGVTEQRRVRKLQLVRCASTLGWPIQYESWDEVTCEAGQCAAARGWLSAAGVPQTIEESTSGCSRMKKPGAPDREDPGNADLRTKHLDGQRLLSYATC